MDMRKWMRDRLRRRKQKPAAPDPNAPAPLQPMYSETSGPMAADGDEAVEEASPAEVETEFQEPDADEPEPEAAEPGNEAPAAETPDRTRRRRKRGGRGRRKGPGQPPLMPKPSHEGEPAAARHEPHVAPRPHVPAPAAQAPKPSKGTVVLAIGLPGSGKTTWFKRRGVTPLSSDLLRTLLFDNITEQRYQDLVFSTLRSLLRARLIARMPWNYVDATNLSPHERRGWIKMSRDFGFEVQAVFFDVPLEVCLERNLRRQRVVPEDVMHRMASKLRPPTFDEGFSKITVVRVKRKE